MIDILKRIIHEPLGFFGLILVTLIVICAILASVIAPYDPIAINIIDRLQGPSANHLLGTDQLGRDLFSRVLFGGQIALKVALVSISVALGIGVLLGMLAGFGPRWLDNIIMLFFDTIRSFPTVMFALATVALVGPSGSTYSNINHKVQPVYYSRTGYGSFHPANSFCTHLAQRNRALDYSCLHGYSHCHRS